MKEKENDDIDFTYPAQDKIEVFFNNGGGITIRSEDFWTGESVITLNADAAKYVINAISTLLKVMQE